MALHLDNYITGFDFNPAGDSIATIDSYGVCLISDLNTNNYGFHIEFKKRGDSYFQKYSPLILLIIIFTFLTNLTIELAFFLFL